MNIRSKSDAEDIVREGVQWFLDRISDLEEENRELTEEINELRKALDEAADHIQ